MSCPSLGLSRVPVSFQRSSPFTLRNGIDCFDLAGDLFVVGGKDGLLRVGHVSGHGTAVDLDGHLSDVRAVKFFPSGQVVLSAGTDMTVRVHSAVDGSNPRTLTGHTKAVTAIGIVGVGKQVVSASSDCTVKIWTVATSTCDKTIRFTSPITSLCLISTEPDVKMAVAHSNGKASLVTLASLDADPSIEALTDGSSDSPLLVIACSSTGDLIATGSRDGLVTLHSQASKQATKRLQRSTASITSLSFVNRGTSLLIGNSEGLLALVDTGTGQIVREFVSGDCDSVVGLQSASGTVWSACQDGKLRSF